MMIDDYETAYRAVALDGQEQPYPITKVSGWQQLCSGMVYGRVSIRQEDGYYVVDHLPSGRLITRLLTREKAENLVRAILHSGVDLDNVLDGTPEFARLRDTVQAWKVRRVPQWWAEREKLRSETLYTNVLTNRE